MSDPERWAKIMNPLRRLFSRPEKIRKQVYELSADDLLKSAVWEFCLDEEGEPGQDEATVKPRKDLQRLSDLDGSMIAKADFIFGDGKRGIGYIYASPEGTLPAIQPVILTPSGQVMFWYGIIAPEEDRQKESRARLALVSDRPFPIRFSCSVPIDDEPIEGVLEGLYHYDRNREIQVIK